MALGARSADIVRMVTGEAARLLGIGLLVSGVLAVPGLLALRSELPFLQPFDPLVIIPTALILAVTALAASVIPARRASAIPASVALRAE
jgi:ABC-type antimicrobial peptide transport system permease subunit